MDVAIQRHAARGGAVLGVCGGLQMLGLSLHDPQGHDGQAVHDLPGLALLPVRTHFGPGKQLLDGAVAFGAPHGSWAALASACTRRAIRSAAAKPLPQPNALCCATHVVKTSVGSRAACWVCMPTVLFESPGVLQALFGATVPTLQDAFETLADLAEAHLEPGLLARLLGQSAA
jgi:adenosylcobyric acid synthase